MNNKKESHHHSGSYMVRRNLHTILKNCEELMQHIDEHDEIESWMEHKISVAKAAISDVKDAFTYDKEEGEDSNGGVDITILRGDKHQHNDMGLSKMMGGCGANENKVFLGSGAINEKRQLITNNSNLKVIVESIQNQHGVIKVTTKGGKSYEYLPHFGHELEILRCEGYGIKIVNEMMGHSEDEGDTESHKDKMMAHLKDMFPGANEDSMEVAIYWFAYNHHEGQFSDLYSTLSTSDYKPSRLTMNIDDEDDEMAKEMYQELESEFAS